MFLPTKHVPPFLKQINLWTGTPQSLSLLLLQILWLQMASLLQSEKRPFPFCSVSLVNKSKFLRRGIYWCGYNILRMWSELIIETSPSCWLLFVTCRMFTKFFPLHSGSSQILFATFHTCWSFVSPTQKKVVKKQSQELIGKINAIFWGFCPFTFPVGRAPAWILLPNNNFLTTKMSFADTRQSGCRNVLK